MSLNLDKYMDEFESLLVKPGIRSNYMPIIRNIFIPFILDEHRDINTEEDLFRHEISKNDVIRAGVRYVDNTDKVKGQGAIRKYLTVVGEFYRKVIDKKFPHNSLVNVSEIQSLEPDIENLSSKMLAERKAHPHIDDTEFNIIVNYLKRNKSTVYKDSVISVSLKLMLLYGFKIGVLSSFLKTDYSTEMRTLRISHSNGLYTRLELPYAIAKQIDWIVANSPVTSELVLANEYGGPIVTGYFHTILDDLDSSDENVNNVHFTLSGMSKYAAIRMFIKGVNSYTISGITGMGPVDIDYCQREAARILNSTISINSYMRGMRSYDVFNDVT